MKKLRRWPRLVLAALYILIILVLCVFIVNEFIFVEESSFTIDKGEYIVFGISVIEESPSTLLSELQVDRARTDWATSFLLQSQSPSAQIYLDYISVFDDGNTSSEPEFCISSIHLSQNDKVPLNVFVEINHENSLGKITSADDKYPDQYVFTFNERLCLKKGAKYFMPHLFLGMVSSETYAAIGPIRITGQRAFEFFPFEEQKILVNIISGRSSITGNEDFFRPSLEVAISQQGWIGEFYTDKNGLTNLRLSRHFFYKFILIAFSLVMAILVIFLNNIVDDASSFFEISFGLLLGLWGTHEILIPGYIDSSVAIDVFIYLLYILVIGEISIVFLDELLVDWKKRKVRIVDIVKTGINNECVTIENFSRIPIDMTNWILYDEVGHRFKFPVYILRGRSKVKVWTSNRGISDNAYDHLYWGRRHSVWNDTHDTAYLDDAKGEMIHQHSYTDRV